MFTDLLNEDSLLLLQDICIQCVFAGLSWDDMFQCTEKLQSDSSQKTLYSPQCLLSALRAARKLTQAKQARTLLSNVKHPPIELTKGDNSGMHINHKLKLIGVLYSFSYVLIVVCICVCVLN